MLTVKHVEPSGHETVTEIRRASFQPTPPTLFLEQPDGTLQKYAAGSFFIMNDAGKTVAKYWIGDNLQPVHHEVTAPGAPQYDVVSVQVEPRKAA